MSVWIFQGNPKYFAVRAAVQELKEIAWRTTRYKDKIQPGDRVYIWESGSQGGIVATSTVLERPKVEETWVAETKYILKPEKLAGNPPRARLHIDEVVEPILSRAEISAQPELGNLSILRQPNSTNFSVSPSEARVLDILLSKRGSDIPQ